MEAWIFRDPSPIMGWGGSLSLIKGKIRPYWNWNLTKNRSLYFQEEPKDHQVEPGSPSSNSVCRTGNSVLCRVKLLKLGFDTARCWNYVKTKTTGSLWSSKQRGILHEVECKIIITLKSKKWDLHFMEQCRKTAADWGQRPGAHSRELALWLRKITSSLASIFSLRQRRLD